MKAIGKFLVTVLFGIPSSLFGGFVVARYWEWFVLPEFTNAPGLSYLHAIGLMLFMGALLAGRDTHKTAQALTGKAGEGDDTTLKSVAASVVLLVVVYPLLGTGYLWHLVIR